MTVQRHPEHQDDRSKYFMLKGSLLLHLPDWSFFCTGTLLAVHKGVVSLDLKALSVCVVKEEVSNRRIHKL